MITVHHLNNSRSLRVLWLLEELGLPYEIKFYQRDKVTMLAPKELRAVHPLGKSPVITEGDLTLAETGAIVEYVLDTYGKGRLRPPRAIAGENAEERLFKFYLHYAEGSLMPALLLALVFNKISGPPMPFFLRPAAKAIATGVNLKLVNPQLKTHFDFLESELSQRKWIAGDEFTAADIQMSFPIEAGATRVGYSSRPHVQKYLEKLKARPAYKKALERGGPYQI